MRFPYDAVQFFNRAWLREWLDNFLYRFTFTENSENCLTKENKVRFAIPSARFEFSRVNAAIEKRDVKSLSKISRWTGMLPVNGSRVTVYSIDCSLAEVASGWQLASNCRSGQTNIHGKDARRGCPSLPSPLIKPSNCQTSDRAFKHLDKVAFRPFTRETAGSVTLFSFSFSPLPPPLP